MFVLEREVATAALIAVPTGIGVIVSLFISVSEYNLKTHIGWWRHIESMMGTKRSK